MKYYDIIDTNHYIHTHCRCADSMTKDDLQRYFEKIGRKDFFVAEMTEEEAIAKKWKFYLDCDTEEKADKIRNITFWRATWIQWKEEFPILLIAALIVFLLMLAFPYICIIIFLAGLVFSILFKS